MAILKEAFTLCRLPSEEELVGVCDGNKDDQVIVSFKSKGISVYKISNQKLLHCWSPRQVHSITAPVLWDPSNEQLIAVHNSTIIRKWTLEEMNFEEAKKKHVSVYVYGIVM
ncbi:nucleolar protein 11-like [Octopus sinensis]|uniref:Nucleolar protein 11-like n=1 Tax=Octopus sinensis TaxID=2607531 RepID=A0A6P7U928_9MOLL|nr:nucleolar protein 11-like [Octopus sinensis]